MQINISVINCPKGFDVHLLLRELFHTAQFHLDVLDTVSFQGAEATISGTPRLTVGQPVEVVPF